MDADQVRTFLLTLPHVVETMQWGDNLVYWVGDKAIGGKMFALVNLDESISHGVISYSAGSQRYPELLEIDGLYPAPYMARIFWVAAERWNVLRTAEWQDELRAAHTITLAKLPPKVHKALTLPAKELKRLVRERTAVLAAKKKLSQLRCKDSSERRPVGVDKEDFQESQHCRNRHLIRRERRVEQQDYDEDWTQDHKADRDIAPHKQQQTRDNVKRADEDKPAVMQHQQEERSIVASHRGNRHKRVQGVQAEDQERQPQKHACDYNNYLHSVTSPLGAFRASGVQ